MNIEWTEAHKREALIRASELQVEWARESSDSSDENADRIGTCYLLDGGRKCIASADAWRTWLRRATLFSNERIEREVRRVDGLATGRLVREVWYCIRWRGSDDLFGRSQSRADAEASVMRERPRGARGCIVRVTRIRRAP